MTLWLARGHRGRWLAAMVRRGRTQETRKAQVVAGRTWEGDPFYCRPWEDRGQLERYLCRTYGGPFEVVPDPLGGRGTETLGRRPIRLG